MFCRLLYGLWVQLVLQSVMTHQLSGSTSAPLNSLLYLNLNINLNHKTMVHDDIYNVKDIQTDTLYEPVLFDPHKQISHLHYVQSDKFY